MFEGSTQTVMIVKGSGREAPYAQLFFQLIGKISNFESSQPITESEYQKSFSTIDNISKGKVIFFGNGKEAKVQGKSINWQHDCFGMKYGWLGNRCVISADPAAISSQKNQDEFAEYFTRRIAFFKELVSSNEQIVDPDFLGDASMWKSPETSKKAGEAQTSEPKEANALAKIFALPISHVEKGVENLSIMFKKSDIWKHQYELLVCEFIFNGLEQFVENINDKIAKDQVVIVYDVKDAEYAHLLHNLIQQYSGYDVAELTENIFIDNAKTLSSQNKIIFLGKTKSSKERWLDIHRYDYNAYGMYFGWIGNHAFVHTGKLKANEKDAFLSEYARKSKGYENKAAEYTKHDYNIKPILDFTWYQYQILLREFVFNGLDEFMED